MKSTLSNSVPPGASRPRRSCLRGCLVDLVLVCLAVPLLAALGYGLDAVLMAPWAYALNGRPTLTGGWMSEFTAPAGARFALFLSLQHKWLSTNEDSATEPFSGVISGQGSWCDDHGRHGDNIPLDGYVPVHLSYHGAASQVEIDLQSAQTPQPGLQPAYFHNGHWNADTLTLKTDFIFWDSEKRAMVSSTSDPNLNGPPVIVLHKADEAAYSAACARLRGA